jgi:hypothetical protein
VTAFRSDALTDAVGAPHVPDGNVERVEDLDTDGERVSAPDTLVRCEGGAVMETEAGAVLEGE